MEKNHEIPPFSILENSDIRFEYGQERAGDSDVREAIQRLLNSASAQEARNSALDEEAEAARAIGEQLYEIHDECLHDDSGDPYSERLYRADANLDRAISLLHDNDLFARVFQTEKGSIYFQTQNGCTLRIKSRAECGLGLSRIQPVTRRGYFISRQDFEAEKAAGTFRESSLAGHTIPVGPLEIGARSLDFDGLPGRRVILAEQDGRISILGESGHGEITNSSSSTFHIGNQVTEILRNRTVPPLPS